MCSRGLLNVAAHGGHLALGRKSRLKNNHFSYFALMMTVSLSENEALRSFIKILFLTRSSPLKIRPGPGCKDALREVNRLAWRRLHLCGGCRCVKLRD